MMTFDEVTAILPTFNPTMVRLLQEGCTMLQQKTYNFQSHNGAIAARKNEPQATLEESPFNPTMVRLLLEEGLASKQ